MSPRRVAIVGAALSDTGRVDDKTVHELHYQGVTRALADAGLTKDDVQGFCSCGTGALPPVELAEYLGLGVPQPGLGLSCRLLGLRALGLGRVWLRGRAVGLRRVWLGRLVLAAGLADLQVTTGDDRARGDNAARQGAWCNLGEGDPHRHHLPFTQPKNTGLNEQNFFTADVRPAEFAEFGLDPVELFSEPATDFRAQFGRKILCKGPPTAGGFGNANRGPG